MRSNALMKANVDAFLRARGYAREDLSKWCRREVSWTSKILGSTSRWFPMKYWDRISDFLGVPTYQLLQPGHAAQFERRSRERRSGKDRRLRGVNQQVRESVVAVASSLTAEDVAFLLRVRSLDEGGRALLEKSLRRLPREKKRGPKTAPAPGLPPSTG
jgi:hypothetical protein